MKEYVEIIQEQDPLSPREFVQDTIGHQYKQMPRLTLKLVTNVSALEEYLDDHLSILFR